MGLPVEVNNLLLGGARAYTIGRSLRFRSSASAYLNRTPASVSNRQTWTWSGWVKRGGLGTTQRLMSVVSSNGTVLNINSSDQIQISTGDGGTAYNLVSSSVYRDPSAWYHIVFVCNTTSATTTQTGTTTDRLQMWVNGIQLSAFSTNQVPTLNFAGFMNTTNAHYIGSDVGTASYLNGYLAEVNFIDGQALTPSSFGAYDTNGIWQPKKYAGTYGTNGFYLNFSDNSAATAAAIGKDFSGNSNNWTPNNISLTAGTTYDSMIDSPTNFSDGSTYLNRGNYSTFNSVVRFQPNNTTYSSGNLGMQQTGGASGSHACAISSIAMPSGKWYAEFTDDTATYDGNRFGILNIFNNSNYTNSNPFIGWASDGYVIYKTSTPAIYKNNNGVTTQIASSNWSAGANISIAVDIDNSKIWWRVNGGAWLGGGDPAAGTSAVFTIASNTTYAFAVAPYNNNAVTANFGQRPFTYTPPAGFKALNTYNLPAATINNGAQNFAATTYTATPGTGATISNAVNGVGFQPDLLWVKNRNNVEQHYWQDSVRGFSPSSNVTKMLNSNSTAAESSLADITCTTTSSGFTVVDSVPTSGEFWYTNRTYVGWQWKAGSNSSRTYTVTVSGGVFYIDGKSNPVIELAEGSTYIFDQSSATNIGHPLKFSSTTPAITLYETGVTYVGTPGYSGAYTQITVASGAPTLYYVCTVHGAGMGNTANTNSTTGASNFAGSINSVVNVNTTAGFSIVTYTETSGSYTVGHSLGVAPSMIIVRERNAVSNWVVWQNYWTAPTKNGVYLNGTAAAFTTGSNWLNSTSSTTFGITAGQVTAGTANIVAYCFAAIRNYSVFGSYTGNGSADGPFVYTGHRPRWIMIKHTGTSMNWYIFDTSRDTLNVAKRRLFPNLSDQEYDNVNFADFLSNGFKIRSNDTGWNQSGSIYIYAAFAENPFNISRAR